MASRGQTLSLIEAYLRAVDASTARLCAMFGVDSLDQGRRSGVVPRSGAFGDGGEFRFHGVGCRIDDGATAVDFDFGPGGRTDGFDAWRLHLFALDQKRDEGSDRVESWSASRSELQDALDALARDGVLSRLDGEPLFYLASTVEPAE